MVGNPPVNYIWKWSGSPEFRPKVPAKIQTKFRPFLGICAPKICILIKSAEKGWNKEESLQKCLPILANLLCAWEPSSWNPRYNGPGGTHRIMANSPWMGGQKAMDWRLGVHRLEHIDGGQEPTKFGAMSLCPRFMVYNCQQNWVIRVL